MRFISTATHGIIDYLMGAFLIVSPWIFGFSDIAAATWVVIIIGAGAILYSLLTDYERGVFRQIPMSGHLWLDAISGAVLALSPWLFGFAEFVFWPHLILGIAEIIASVTTKTEPAHSRMQTNHI
jgi:hypothetical protein